MDEMALAAGPGRTHRYFRDTSLWNFGFGLSYTTFELTWSRPAFVSIDQTDHDASTKISECGASDKTAKPVDHAIVLDIDKFAQSEMRLVLPISLANLGSWNSADVVQVYVAPSSVALTNDAPIVLRQLVSFERVSVDAGDKVCVLVLQQLAIWTHSVAFAAMHAYDIRLECVLACGWVGKHCVGPRILPCAGFKRWGDQHEA